MDADFFKALLDVLPHPAFAADASGAIVFANRRAAERFGALDGKSVHSRRWPADIEAIAIPGAPGFTLYSARDSTSLRRTLDSSPIGIARIRFNGEVMNANPAFLGLFGMDRPQFEREGLNVWESTPPEWRETTSERLGLCRRTFQPVLCEKEYCRRDGTRVAVMMVLTVHQEDPDFARVFALDVTARNSIESQLRSSEARLRSTLESLPGMMFTAGPAGGNTFTSGYYQRYTGRTPEELLGDGWIGILHPDDRARAAEIWGDSVRTGAEYEVEYRVRRHDGVYRWHLCKGLPQRDARGEITAWLGVCTDIEDYKTIHQSLEKLVEQRTWDLRRSEEQYRALIDGIEDYAILRLDPNGVVQNWNPCAERTKGYTAGEIIGRNFSCFYPPEEVERGHPQEILRIAARDGHFEENGWRLRKDGSRFWANVSITAIRNEAGEVTGYSKVTRDTTERALAEDRLRESEQRFRAVLESAPDAMMLVDGQGRIVLANAQAGRVFGYDTAELTGKAVETLTPPAVRALLKATRGDHFARPRAWLMGSAMGWTGLRKDGSEFPAEVSLSPIMGDGSDWVVASVRDVTERTLIEQQLVAERIRAEEANRSKSNFLAAMSHEIRTPMNAILGMSDLLWESDLNADQRQYVEVFRRAGSNLLILINDILDLSKIEAGRFELERSPFQLDEVVDQTTELIAPRAHKKGIRMAIRIAPEARQGLIGDATRLRQVLLNLLGNAVKFTEAGEIRLQIRCLEAGEAGDLEFSVEDTGIGIAPDKLEMIFDDFTQADSGITRKYAGTGLGLGISRRIVELMGGRLRVTSELGKGSRFSFDAHFEVSAGQSMPQEVLDLHGRRVLVVDDNATNRLILHETFAAWGLESREYASAINGLREIVGHPQQYALVILDRNMPDMDGFAAAERFQTLAPAVPIVMLTSEGDLGDGARWRRAGLAGYALKPIKRSELFRIVCQVIKAGELPEVAPAVSPATASVPLRILVAEDSADNRLLVKAYMKGSPHRLTFVEDGKSAVDQFAGGGFDLILMDVQMPVMDGLTAAREIRRIEHTRGCARIPIIALTAHASQRDVEKAQAAGCDLHLAKPISKQRLLDALAKFGPTPREGSILIEVPEGIEELAPMYVADRRADVAEYRSLLAEGNFGRIAGMAHNMKGTGSSFGMPDLTRLGRAMESAAQRSDRSALADLLAELADYLDRVHLPAPAPSNS